MAEITLGCKLARDYTMENVPDALAYLLIKVVPNPAVDFGSLPVNLGLVIDVSGSMRGQKIKNAKQAAKHVVNLLKPADTVSVTIFGDEARAIVPATKVTEKFPILSAIDKISIVGGTRMYHGLEVGAREIRRAATPTTIDRMIVLTDGETEGEEQCMNIARQEAQNNLVITAFGVGTEYNEEFLKEISDTTLGSFYHLQTPEQISSEFARELAAISAAVISNVKLSLNMVKDVQLEELHRIYPNTARLLPEMDADGRIASVTVGNLRKDDKTVFGAQLQLPAKSEGRVRIAQVFITYNIPSMQVEDRVGKSDVIIRYTGDRDLCGRADREVISYFNQLTAQSLTEEAMRQTRVGNIAGATEALNQALLFTQKIGNIPLTRNIEAAMYELKEKGTISAGLMKTVRAGSGHTVRIEDEEPA
jgi:Ca-activated chloride channel family protein